MADQTVAPVNINGKYVCPAGYTLLADGLCHSQPPIQAVKPVFSDVGLISFLGLALPNVNAPGSTNYLAAGRVELASFTVTVAGQPTTGLLLFSGDARNVGGSAVNGYVQCEVDGIVVGDISLAVPTADGLGWGTYKFVVQPGYGEWLHFVWPLTLAAGVHTVRILGGTAGAGSWQAAAGSDPAAWIIFDGFSSSKILMTNPTSVG